MLVGCTNRRAFIAGLGCVAAWPMAAEAQQSSRRALVAYLGFASRDSAPYNREAFLNGLRDLGQIEGQTFDIEYRYADGIPDRLDGLAKELVQLKPDVIYTIAAPSVRAVTETIPIVSPTLVGDPVRMRLAASHAHPGGNVTGILNYVEGLVGKQLEIALQLVPGSVTVGFLDNALSRGGQRGVILADVEQAARVKGVKLLRVEVHSPSDIAPAFESFIRNDVSVVLLPEEALFFSERATIARVAIAARISVVGAYRDAVVDGVLISYGVDLRDCFRRSAAYVDKILRGAKAGDLPIEFPNKLEMVINSKTAKTLGLELPPSLLVRADEVIE